MQGPGIDSSASLRQNTSDCIRVASSIAVELQFRIARFIASPDSSQQMSLPFFKSLNYDLALASSCRARGTLSMRAMYIWHEAEEGSSLRQSSLGIKDSNGYN